MLMWHHRCSLLKRAPPMPPPMAASLSCQCRHALVREESPLQAPRAAYLALATSYKPLALQVASWMLVGEGQPPGIVDKALNDNAEATTY